MAAEDADTNSSVVPKAESESILDGFTPSSASSPTAEPDALIPIDPANADPVPVVKRKGGRKPIYATSEERKQRNRQAQAAFRERRTEYIKQLESTIQHHEETLQNLQQSHRTAADECLMLRYKNSLLERILLEKGIDVQAELRLKASPHLRPIHHSTPIRGQTSSMQKAIINRQQQVRQRPVLNSPIQTQTPTSQHSSPSALRSPAFSMHAGMTSPTVDLQVQQQQQSKQAAAIQPNTYAAQSRSHLRTASSNSMQQSFNHAPRHQPSTSMQSNYYPTSFQKHYDQLDQEYDAQNEMLDDADGDDVDTDSFIPNFRLPPTNSSMPMGMQISPPATATSTTSEVTGGGQNVPFDYDPMLDADPFGLTASMHFPNAFSFASSHVRR